MVHYPLRKSGRGRIRHGDAHPPVSYTHLDQFRGMLERAGLPAAQAQQVTEIATGVRRESIESALDAIEEKYPSFEEYLRAEFEIGAAELEDIRARYLV